MLTAAAPAKINLALRVLGTRPDGFHEIESLVARIALTDEVRAAPRREGDIRLTCSDPRLATDESNLVVRAAVLLRRAAGVAQGATLHLEKRIPAGAGLGGGSSDAAATLRLLSELWSLNWPAARLQELSAELGSDVPLFLSDGPLCLLGGRGERVAPVARPLSAAVCLVLPGLQCATPAVYRAFDELPTPGERPAIRTLLERLPSPGEPGALERWARGLYNDLEPAARRVCPPLGVMLDKLRGQLDPGFHMTGSGAALFRLCAEACTAAELADSVQERFGVRAMACGLWPE